MKCVPLVAAVLALVTQGIARGDVRLPRIFGDHMVLQRESAVPIWGWADPGEEVTITSGPQSASVVTGTDGKWKVLLGKLEDSPAPIEVTITGKNTIVLHDVLVGDVWVCSGQSNMEFGMTGGIYGDTSAKEEIPKANYPGIRLFVVPKIAAPRPADDIAPGEGLRGSWQVCSPQTLPKLYFSAVAYYFGRNIHEAIGKPVGLIETCWGGTRAEVWTDFETLEGHPEFKGYAEKAAKFRDEFSQRQQNYPRELESFKAKEAQWKEENKEALAAFNAAQALWMEEAGKARAEGKPNLPPKPKPLAAPQALVRPDQVNYVPCANYNGMIAPLIPLAIKGVAWYQGESNADKRWQAIEYNSLFPTMIGAWRRLWGQGDFPFVFVQLANYRARNAEPGESNWAILREAQSKALAVPNTAIAVTVDIGEATDIHPKDKWDVGNRLALAARHLAYGEDIPWSGPVYNGMKREGGEIRVLFTHTNGGLEVGVPPPHFHPGEARSPVAELQGFSIAGADGKFVWAKARIEGESVIVSSPSISNPVAVRYAWADNPAANLYNKAGLPASPFRTDSDPFAPEPSTP